MPLRYGLWLLTSPRSFQDPRIWREDKYGYEIPTIFQRSVGVKYSKSDLPRFPDSKGGYASYGHTAPPKNINLLLKGFFTAGPMPPQKLALRPGYRALLARSTGYVVLWAPRLRRISVKHIGAHLIGTVLVSEKNVP